MCSDVQNVYFQTMLPEVASAAYGPRVLAAAEYFITLLLHLDASSMLHSDPGSEK